MSKTLEANLYHAVKNVNDLTKSNIGQTLLEAASTGKLTLTPQAVREVVTLVSSLVDQSTDVLHAQVLRTVASEQSSEGKKKDKKS